MNLDNDGFDHTVRIDDGTTRVDSVLSPDGRMLRRTVSSPPGVTVTEDRWYGYTDGSDSPAWSQATTGGAVTTYLPGLIVTGTTPSYEVSDPKGTIVGTVNQAGAWAVGSYPDEYGNVAAVPASRLDWLGTQERFVDHPGLDIVRMGVRAYDPHLGRFLSQDPIAGGSANDYDYVNADPINNLDLGGTRCWLGVKARRTVRVMDAKKHRKVLKTIETCNGAREVVRNVRHGMAPVGNAALRYAPTVGRAGILIDGCVRGAVWGAIATGFTAAATDGAGAIAAPVLIPGGCTVGAVAADYGISF